MAGGVRPRGPLLRAILPKPFDRAAFDSRIRAGANEFKDAVKYDFDNTVRNWSGEKPTFQPKVYISATQIKIVVALTGNAKGVEKWKYLNFGVRAHVIRAHNGRRLRFRLGHVAKTQVGSLLTSQGKPAGGAVVYARQVMHPGIEARGWDEMIAKKNQVEFQKAMERYVRWAVRDSGYAYP